MTQACAALWTRSKHSADRSWDALPDSPTYWWILIFILTVPFSVAFARKAPKPRACWSTFWDALFAMAALGIVTFKPSGFCTELTGFSVGLEVLVDETAIVDIGNIIWLWLQGTFGGNAGQPNAEGCLLPKLTSNSLSSRCWSSLASVYLCNAFSFLWPDTWAIMFGAILRWYSWLHIVLRAEWFVIRLLTVSRPARLAALDMIWPILFLPIG